METNTSPAGTQGMEDSGSCCSVSLDKVKGIIADKLDHFAGKLAQTADEHGDCSIAQQGKQASVWLEKSADYVRNFDYEETNAKVRESVKQNPGRALLLAGAAGLILGALCRRR